MELADLVVFILAKLNSNCINLNEVCFQNAPIQLQPLITLQFRHSAFNFISVVDWINAAIQPEMEINAGGMELSFLLISRDWIETNLIWLLIDLIKLKTFSLLIQFRLIKLQFSFIQSTREIKYYNSMLKRKELINSERVL